jgi:ABC-2 type transport system ATP-binding protein
MRALTGYLPPSDGEVEVFGHSPIEFDSSDRRRMGFMPQGFVLDEGLTVRQNLDFVGGAYRLKFRERRRLMREALEFVELWDDRRKAASSLSGGMQRRLQLAAAIVHEPRLLFIDEPTANLDPVLRRKFWDEFRLLRHRGRTIFSDGKLIAVGTPRELRRQAFGGETIELALAEEMGRLDEYITVLKEVGRVVEVREDEESGESVSRVSLIVDDADAALPEVFKALEDADLRFADVINPSFDEVFLRLVRGGN